MIRLIVKNNKISVTKTKDDEIVSGLVGKKIYVEFSVEWGSLQKVAVCSGSGAVKDVIITGEYFVLPHEVVSSHGTCLNIGIYGFSVSESNVVTATPTLYADLGMIGVGADPSGDESIEPTPGLWEQMQNEISAETAERIRICADLAQAIVNESEERAESVAELERKIPPDLTDSVAGLERDVEDIVRDLSGKAPLVHNHNQYATKEELSGYQIAGDYASSADLNEESRARSMADDALSNRVSALEQGGGGGSGAVASVNGKTGAVVLNAADVGAAASNHNHNGTYQPVGDYAAEQHKHTTADIEGLTSGVGAVKINGTELPKDDEGAVEIPKSNGQTFGLVKSGTGVSSTNGTLNLVQASDYGLNNRTNTGAITPPIIDKAVLASLTDGKSSSLWTEDKQAAARALLGISIWDGGVSE